MKIERQKDAYHKRYSTRFGTLVINRQTSDAAYIPRHTPHVAVYVTRQQAAEGLRTWRKLQEVNTDAQ